MEAGMDTMGKKPTAGKVPPKKVGRPKGKPRTAAEKAADARRTGRPPKPECRKQVVLVSFRLTPAELTQYRRDAKQAGFTCAAYAKHCWRQIRKEK